MTFATAAMQNRRSPALAPPAPSLTAPADSTPHLLISDDAMDRSVVRQSSAEAPAAPSTPHHGFRGRAVPPVTCRHWCGADQACTLQKALKFTNARTHQNMPECVVDKPPAGAWPCQAEFGVTRDRSVLAHSSRQVQHRKSASILLRTCCVCLNVARLAQALGHAGQDSACAEALLAARDCGRQGLRVKLNGAN